MSNYPYCILSTRYEAVDCKVSTLPEKPVEPQLKLVKKNWFEKLILWCDEYDDQLINERRKMRYAQQMEQYNRDLRLYQEEIGRILSDTNIDIFRQGERKKIIGSMDTGEELQRDVQKG